MKKHSAEKVCYCNDVESFNNSIRLIYAKLNMSFECCDFQVMDENRELFKKKKKYSLKDKKHH